MCSETAQRSFTRFQSTLPQGERPYFLSCAESVRNFNPRSHKGSDSEKAWRICRFPYFNPRSHKGSDGTVAISSVGCIFQSTLPQGERQGLTDTAIPRQRFQSTLPQGERRRKRCQFSKAEIFQSTLPQGERHNSGIYFLTRTDISIHAPTRGATAILHKIPYLFYFIFTNPFPISYFHTQPASDF